MKVIRTDNLDRCLYPDALVLDGLTEEQANTLADNLERIVASNEWYFQAVEDDYKLFVPEE